MSTALSRECPYVPQNLPVLQRKPLDSNCSLNSKQANILPHQNGAKMLALRQAEGVQEQPAPLLPNTPPSCPLSSHKAILFSRQSPVHMASEPTAARHVMNSSTPQGHCLWRLAGCLLHGSFRGLWGCCRLFCCKPLGGCCLLSLPSEPRRESGVLRGN